MEQSLLVTGFGYEHDDAWTTNINLFKEFTDISRVSEHFQDAELNFPRFVELNFVSLPFDNNILCFFKGVRRLGSAASDMSHVGLGITEAYWEYRLKPWDMAAGALV